MLRNLPKDERPRNATLPVYDRAFLLHGSKRNEVLSLAEIEQYGRDSFADPDYLSIYGMSPREWYGCGIRLLGRTAVSAELKGSHFGRFRMSQIFDECLRGAGMRWPRSQIKQ